MCRMLESRQNHLHSYICIEYNRIEYLLLNGQSLLTKQSWTSMKSVWKIVGSSYQSGYLKHNKRVLSRDKKCSLSEINFPSSPEAVCEGISAAANYIIDSVNWFCQWRWGSDVCFTQQFVSVKTPRVGFPLLTPLVRSSSALSSVSQPDLTWALWLQQHVTLLAEPSHPVRRGGEGTETL